MPALGTAASSSLPMDSLRRRWFEALADEAAADGTVELDVELKVRSAAFWATFNLSTDVSNAFGSDMVDRVVTLIGIHCQREKVRIEEVSRCPLIGAVALKRQLCLLGLCDKRD